MRVSRPSPDDSPKSVDATVVKLMESLDSQDDSNPAAVRRGNSRVRYRKRGVPIRVTHPGGGVTSRVVITRNLSGGGMAVLYNGYLHVGSTCEVALRRNEDVKLHVVTGSVVCCDHVAGTTHNVGIRFDEPIRPDLYVDPRAWIEVLSGVPVDPKSLRGSVLYLDPDPVERQLFVKHLAETSLTIHAVATIDEAAAVMVGTPFDAVLCDLNLGGSGGDEAIVALRGVGFVGAIGVLTAETTPARLTAVEAAGATAIVRKPYSRDRLLALLSRWLGTTDAGPQGLLHSTLGTADADIVHAFLERIDRHRADLRTHLANDAADAVRSLCVGLSGSAAGCGFEPVGRLATDVVRQLDAGRTLAELRETLNRLQLLCARLAPPLAPPANEAA